MLSTKACREFARKNYHPLTDIPGNWHPTIQRECALMNEEVCRWMQIGLSRASAEVLVADSASVTIYVEVGS